MSSKITTLDEVIGHRNIIDYLKKREVEDNVPHKLLFYGQAGIGKTSIALALAIGIICRGDSRIDRDALVKNVIYGGNETDNIKIFDMALIAGKEEEINRAKSELSMGFVTGRKVVIYDECHRMHEKAQDALLVDLEHTDDNIWVIMMTSELNMIGEALQSRMRRIPLTGFTSKDVERLALKEIGARKLKFTMKLDVVISLICYYSKNQARDCIELLDSFPDNSIVTSEDLSTFINTNAAQEMIHLVKYLYSSMTLGLDYISTLNLDSAGISILIELVKVAMGGKSNALSPEEFKEFKELMAEEDVNNLLGFVISLSGMSKFVNNNIKSVFMKNHKYLQSLPVEDKTGELSMVQDLVTMREVDRSEGRPIELTPEESKAALPTLESMFADLPKII